ncbi:hypothetical protein [Sphingobium nicotianae]|uniref:hypothetical protein n=1 Tax=Sphingobium nicotianae TaxID=2782607 RepID=UPI001BE48722|nr:hypothetical protein [Sphingobium nicotianae]
MALLAFWLPTSAWAAECFSSSVARPTPFMGNNDEVFQLSDGSIWQVKYSYEYLYAYTPSVIVCPDRGVMAVEGKTISVIRIRPSEAAPQSKAQGSTPKNKPNLPPNALTVVLRKRGCDYFIADGPQGYYILEWYGGHDPEIGEALVGYQSGYGFKDIIYLKSGDSGRVWVEDYLLGKDRALEKFSEKCE